MKTPNADRARILVHALPYIKKYNGKIVVIKYGGNAMINEKLKDSVMRDIVLLSLIGVRVVLVHGGGPEITELLSKMGKKTEFVDGLRVTDRETVEVAQMVLAGKINKSLVNLIECRGGKSIGLSGIDGHMIKAKVKDERLGYVGSITDIDPTPITDVLEKGYIPVVSTLGIMPSEMVPSAISTLVSSTVMCEIRLSGLFLSAKIPGVSVSEIRLSAFKAPAILAAAVSALML